jgi:hypothetical protein
MRTGKSSMQQREIIVGGGSKVQIFHTAEIPWSYEVTFLEWGYSVEFSLQKGESVQVLFEPEFGPVVRFG